MNYSELAARLREEKDEAYRQRNVLVAALARLFPSGIRRTNIEGWSDDWNGCVYIDLPSGQISYHYHDSQIHLFDNLPPYTKPWDGHDKAKVEERLATLKARDGYVLVPMGAVEYCRTLVSATCRSLAIANDSKEYDKARQIRALLEEAAAAEAGKGGK